MKNLFLIVFSLLFCVSNTFSQQKSPEEQAKEFTGKLNRELALSSQQARKLNKMLTESYVAADNIRRNTGLSKEIRKEQLKKIYADRTAEMNAIFTAEQKVKYDAYIQSRKTK